MSPAFSYPSISAASLLLAAVGLSASATGTPAMLSDLMPQTGDYTAMWWAEGFPGVIPKAPWKRCVQTGSYAMEQDTETLQFSHLGPVPPGMDNVKFGKSDLSIRQVHSPAKLELMLTANGRTYHCSKGGPWSRFTGPRLIESGLFMQRADITDLEFVAADAPPLYIEARFETAAWPDRLAMIFAARPGREPIQAGEESFGKMGGGYGLTGTNELLIPHEPALDPTQFTLGLWVFVPLDNRNPNHGASWLVCKNRNELVDGNFGIYFQNGVPQARINIGGGRENQHEITPSPGHPLKTDAWSHLTICYDGASLRFYINGQEAGAKKIGKARTPGQHALAIGRREDSNGIHGMYFKGVVDEIRLYDRALQLDEIRQRFSKPELPNPQLKPVREWNFRAGGLAADKLSSTSWKDASMEIKLTSAKGALQMQKRWDLPNDQTWSAADWHQVSLALDPASFESLDAPPSITVKATEMASATARPVEYDPAIGWFKVNLDGIEPTPPPGKNNPSNDAIERIKLTLSNPSNREQMARLMFEKTTNGFHQRIGTAITGVSAILRDMDGKPTGIPVQLSKNWHNEPEGGVYGSAWFHGISQMRLPAGGTVELELTLAYGHWGGVPAASHAQLSLIGWGSNQLWHQSALGSWGESICYEPEQAQANCTVTDVRPAMVKAKDADPEWKWTGNVGGADFLRFFTPAGERVPHSSMRATHHRPGPCLTEVTYTGRIGDGIRHSSTVSLARTDDIVRGIYHIRMDVTKPMEFSRFVVFQIGADTYNSSRERKMAIGNKTGLASEWNTQWGGNTYRTKPVECTGRIPWISMQDGEVAANDPHGTTANRGIVIRSWRARLGGKDASPWMAERGLSRHQIDSSTLDILPPPGVGRLESGDFIEATIEHIIMPKSAKSYYGPSAALRAALTQNENTWRMIQREAIGGDRAVTMKTGTLERRHPDIRVLTKNGTAAFELTGGIGYVPVTFTGLTSPQDFILAVDNAPLNQSVHGNDYWQTDYDPVTRTWSRTYNLATTDGKSRSITLCPTPPVK